MLRRGHSLRLTAGGADANVAALFYSREQPLERYNMADTLKAQHTAHLTTGCVCYSDMGRVLLRHHRRQPAAGMTHYAGSRTRPLIDARYGPTTFQAASQRRVM